MPLYYKIVYRFVTLGKFYKSITLRDLNIINNFILSQLAKLFSNIFKLIKGGVGNLF